MTALVGNDGATTLSGTYGGVINRWQAAFNSVVSNVTSFADTVSMRNRLGLLSIEGSATGFPQADATSNEPGVSTIAANAAGVSIVLTVATGCIYTFTAAFSGIAHDVNKLGDSVLTYNFVNGDLADLVVTWDES